MKIISMLPVLAFGDAVGNDTLAVHNSLKKAGYESVIVAAVIDKRLDANVAMSADDLSWITADDIVIYHLSTGHELNYRFAALPCRKIIKYHNITPPEYFFGYNQNTMTSCMEGYRAASKYVNQAEYCWVDSAYNGEELKQMGYTCPIDVIPILIPFDDYAKKPDKQILERMKDDYVNIIFTGRIAPNKRQEDVIAAFYQYKKYYNQKSRLILVGNHAGMEVYYESLKKYVELLELDDVIFTGHISFEEILAYYCSADIFLCMSDHEGFCVPLVESMYFDVPVLAKGTSAITETLGGSGMILPDNDPMVAASAINRILTDPQLKSAIVANQRERLKDFEHDKIENLLLEKIQKYIAEEY
ncbi:MAG: glycosyltransferase [Lachnospiraceae bacterium]|nr:glycosyltransferase [Lachnospiraceae bacterium]